MPSPRTWLTLLLPLALAAQNADPDEQAVLQAARHARDVSRAGDAAQLQPLLTDDFLAIDPTGQVRGKTEFLDMVRSLSPEMRAASAELQVAEQEVRVRQYGPVAVLTELRVVSSAPEAAPARYTQVWIKHQDAWRLQTVQVTLVTRPDANKK